MNSKNNQFDESLLTAFALDELDSARRAMVKKSLTLEPALAAEVESIRGLASLLRESLQGEESHRLGADRRAQIFKAMDRPDAEVLVFDHAKRSRRHSVMALAGVAAVVTLGFYVLSQSDLKVGAGESVVLENEQSTKGATGEIGEGNLGKAESASGGALVFEGGENALSDLEKKLAVSGELPERSWFRVEEWIQVARPTEEAPLILGGASVWSEVAQSPWHDDRALLMVSFQPDGADLESATAVLEFTSERVKSSRLLSGSEVGDSVVVLKPGISLFELEIFPGEVPMGTVTLHVGKGGSGYHPLRSDLRSEKDCSEGFKVAALMGEFARWAAGEEREVDRLSKMAAAAEKLSQVVKDPEVRYALDLILLSRDAMVRE